MIMQTVFNLVFLCLTLTRIRGELYAGYLSSYFKFGAVEAVYQSISQGQDPYRWAPLHNGAASLTSTIGSGGARDSELVSNNDRTKYYLVATDLHMRKGDDWSKAETNGVSAFVMWTSTDLVNWSQPSHIQVAPSSSHIAWAPCIVNEADTFFFFWTGTAGMYGTISASTRDFKTFSSPKAYKSGAMDMDFVKLPGGEYLRAYKDNIIIVEMSKGGLFGSWTSVGLPISSGEGPALFLDNEHPNTVHLWVDENAGNGYTSYISTNVHQGFRKDSHAIPVGMHHGNVFPLTASEYSRLQGQVEAVKTKVTMSKGMMMHHAKY